MNAMLLYLLLMDEEQRESLGYFDISSLPDISWMPDWMVGLLGIVIGIAPFAFGWVFYKIACM